jgi:hypothetical protein
MIIQLFIILIAGLLIITTIYFTNYNSKDSYYNPPISYRYDPEIAEKSGGMAGFSTSPFDTSSYGGYINYPVIYPSYYPYDYNYHYNRHYNGNHRYNRHYNYPYYTV